MIVANVASTTRHPKSNSRHPMWLGNDRLMIDWVRLNVRPTHYRSYGDGGNDRNNTDDSTFSHKYTDAVRDCGKRRQARTTFNNHSLWNLAPDLVKTVRSLLHLAFITSDSVTESSCINHRSISTFRLNSWLTDHATAERDTVIENQRRRSKLRPN